MMEFRTRMSENGRIIIPAACRRQLKMEPGEELILTIDNEELRVFSLKHSLEKAKALVRKHAKQKNLVKELKNQRNEGSDRG